MHRASRWTSFTSREGLLFLSLPPRPPSLPSPPSMLELEGFFGGGPALVEAKVFFGTEGYKRPALVEGELALQGDATAFFPFGMERVAQKVLSFCRV